jgi:outer membrane protein assembly factor BamB
MPSDISGPADEASIRAAFARVIERHAAHSLVASDGASERIFYFAIGGIRVIRSGPRKTSSVADVLVDAGRISPEDVERVAAAAQREGQTFGEACVAAGLARSEDVDAALRVKVQEELLDLFLWDGAEIHLQEGQPPKAFYEGRFEAARISCDVQSFLDAVVARVDEWRAVLGRLPTGLEVYEATQEDRESLADGAQARLLSLLDGTRTAADAVTRSGMRRVPAYELLLEWMRVARIRRVAGAGAQKVTRDELMREVEALEDALKVTADAAMVRARLAKTLEAAGESSRAAGQWRFLGDRRRRENELERALDCYRNAVRCVPTDFATRELILEIHRHKRDYGQVVADGRPLAELFLKHDLLNRAKHLLLQLVGLEGEDAALRRQLVTVLIGLGERDLALRHLRELAKVLERRDAPAPELRDVYVRTLALAPKDRHARDRLDALTGAKLQRRILRLTLGATAAALAAVLGWSTWQSLAARSANEAIGTARIQKDEKDFVAARETLRVFLDSRYGRGRGADAAQAMLQAIEAYERRELARRAAEGPASATPRQAEESAHQIALRARELADAGRLEDAHRAFRELFELYGATSAAENVAVPLRLTVTPSDARVLLAGEEVGQGSLVLKYSPRAKCTLVVEREGFASYKRVLDGPQEASLDIALERPTRWTFAADAAIDAPPLVAGGMVYVAGRDRRLTALSTSDGAVQWRTPLGFFADAAVRPVLTPEGVVVATALGEAVCVDAATGDVLWRRQVGAGVERQPIVAGDAVVVPATDGSLAAFSAGGELAWKTPAGTAASTPTLVDTDRFAYVDGKGGLVFAAASTGVAAPGYSQPAVLRGSPAVDDGRLWVMADDASLRMISTATRRAMKRFPVASPTEFPPLVAGETAYATSTDGTVHAFTAAGDTLFHAKLDEPSSAPATLSKDRLYVPGQKGRVHVLDARTGAVLWRLDAKARVTAAPVVVDGTLYVATAAGRLLAIAE